MAVVLANAAPEKAQRLMARAALYAENRLVCGMHFRADIVAGQVLGTAIATDLLHDSRFQTDFKAAQAELRARNLAN